MQYLLTVPEELSQEKIRQIAVSIGGELSPLYSSEDYYIPTDEEILSIERGLEDLKTGRLTSHEEVMKQCLSIGL